MKKVIFVYLAAAALLQSAYAQETKPAQEIYVGGGAPGLVALGYARPMGDTWGLRAEYAGGLKLSNDGSSDGVTYAGSVNASHFGGFADWFPFNNGFRVVGGFTVNDIKASLVGSGSGTATINNKTVNMAGETFNVDIKFPSTTPYIGIGYGHQKSTEPGFGFYADLGVMVGTFSSSVSTSLVNKTFSGQTITQADIDAQTQKMRDSLANLSFLPRVAVGVTYRF